MHFLQFAQQCRERERGPEPAVSVALPARVTPRVVRRCALHMAPAECHGGPAAWVRGHPQWTVYPVRARNPMRRNGARGHFAGTLPRRDRLDAGLGPLVDRLAALGERWREDSAALRRRGAAGHAQLLDGCAVELQEVLAGDGPASAVTAEERGKAEAAAPDVLLTVEQVAERLGTTPTWVYAHWQQLGCGQKLGRRTLRFSAAKLQRYLDGPRPHSRGRGDPPS